MIKREFKGLELSLLGLGTMRLPVTEGNDGQIDEAATFAMVDYAMEKGINYYDTAWGYHGGQSEIVTGKALKRYPRESFYLATKFPGYSLDNMGKVVEIFEEQLKKCQVDYFDFYMFHNVNELNINDYLDEKHGIFEHLVKQKENGRIRHLGFSAHGSLEVMTRFLEKYGSAMEFCQIQLNYLDWTLQSAKEKMELLASYGIPVWVMEPLRGGKLAKLAPEHEQSLKALRPDEGVPAWAFRFLEGMPEVKMILSGMSNMEQLVENIETFETEKLLTEPETQALLSIASEMLKKDTLPCTGCKYCLTHCPVGIDVPKMVELYNEHKFTGGGFLAPMVLSARPEDKRPSACLGCGGCEAVCPQQIRITEAMADFAARLAR